MGIIRQAIDVLDSRGWIKDFMFNGRGLCMHGAVLHVACTVLHDTCTNDIEPVKIIAEVIIEQYPDHYREGRHSLDCARHVVWEFNDEIAKDYAEVRAVMEKAALKEEEAA